ncbi:MAG: hypothetical protein L0216_21100 [Planctomycetales bacterium]|nr:hypothetical protein [Planctomycetales bacterium]
MTGLRAALRLEWTQARGRRGPAVGIVAGAAAVAAVLLLAWPRAGSPLAARPALASGLFAALARATLGALALLAPGLAAASLSVERERGTWDLLRTLPVSPHALATAKVATTGAALALAVLAVLPLLSAPLLLGALDAGQAFSAAAVLLGLVPALAGVSVAVAARAWSFGLSLMGAALGSAAVAAAGWVLLDRALAGEVAAGGFALALGAVLGAGGARSAGGAIAREALRVRILQPPADLWKKLGEFADGLPIAGPWLRARAAALVRSPDPLARLEEAAAFGRTGIAPPLGLAFVAALGLGLPALGLELWGATSVGLPALFAAGGALAAGAAAAQAIPRERARGSLDVLRVLPGGLPRVLLAKSRAAARLAVTVLALGGIVLSPILVFHLARSVADAGLLALAGEIAVAAAAVAAGLGIGAAASVLARRPGSALAATLGTTGLLFAGGPLLAGAFPESAETLRRLSVLGTLAELNPGGTAAADPSVAFPALGLLLGVTVAGAALAWAGAWRTDE